jgi:hypothetical protein
MMRLAVISKDDGVFKGSEGQRISRSCEAGRCSRYLLDMDVEEVKEQRSD